MLLQLKQPEIELAISDYLEKLGIACNTKAMDFTAGRNGSGITVDVTLATLATTSETPVALEGPCKDPKEPRKRKVKAEKPEEIVEANEEAIDLEATIDQLESAVGQGSGKSLFG